MSVPSDEGFLMRWSRRKAGVAANDGDVEATARAADAAPPAPAPNETQPLPNVDAAEGPAEAVDGVAAPAAAPAPPPLPTLADVAGLTRESDFSRFVVPGVDRSVSNAAMKKLFSDPHFNVMDGLDTYIGDYSQPDPIPLAMLRKMTQSAALGLFADEDEEKAVPAVPAPAIAADVGPDGSLPVGVAQSSPNAQLPTEPEPPAHDHPDLRLQPDDAARRPGPQPGPRR